MWAERYPSAIGANRGIGPRGSGMTRRWPIGWSATGRSATRRRRPSRPASGTRRSRAAEGAPRFVVQEHHARRLHWDLRLEHDGVLASWAVPRGIPPAPSATTSRCAPRTIRSSTSSSTARSPPGQYGAGTMKIWDRGTYEAHKFRDDEVMVTFHGERVRGRYVLFRTKGDDWMIHRMDPPGGSGPRADARAARADARAHRAAPARRRGAGRTRSSGTACARSRSCRAAGSPAGAQRPRHHRPLPGAAPARPRRSPGARWSSTARWSRSTARGRASRSSRAACT